MNWLYLLIAGVFEIGWPLGFKLSQTTHHRIFWIIFASLSMALSGIFLWFAQKEIPIGTAYAIWTGIGATGTLLIGVLFFKDPANAGRFFFASLIIVGIIGLKSQTT
jgi:quaternary ammonium compound-resistance protein SugE